MASILVSRDLHTMEELLRYRLHGPTKMVAAAAAAQFLDDTVVRDGLADHLL